MLYCPKPKPKAKANASRLVSHGRGRMLGLALVASLCLP